MQDMKQTSREDYARLYKSKVLNRSRSATSIKELMKGWCAVMKKPEGIDQLNEEILEKVLRLLGDDEICVLREVCKKWNRLVEERWLTIWKKKETSIKPRALFG